MLFHTSWTQHSPIKKIHPTNCSCFSQKPSISSTCSSSRKISSVEYSPLQEQVTCRRIMVNTILSVDLSRSPRDQHGHPLHNRWHPDIPPTVRVYPGQVFRVECFDWSGGQIKNNDSPNDILNADLSQAHYLSGPIAVEGAEPGDYLEVEIVDVQPLPGHEWGHTGIFPPPNGGGGLLSEIFTTEAKAIWDFEGIYTKSRHIPHVRFPGLPHPGVVGTAPSQELLELWNQRERTLFNTEPERVPPLAFLPDARGALMGGLESIPEMAKEKAAQAARTIAPREQGGNCDIKNLSKGSKLWLPVYVPGANLSVGDIHFSQGDGEIAFCGGIEMSGAVTMKTSIIRNGVALHGNLSSPIFLPGPVEPRFTKYLTFEGISVDENGEQHYLDATLSFKQAVLNALKYLEQFGYTALQAYFIMTAAPCEARINSIVDVPNACCSIAIPTEIFEFDIEPKKGGHLGTIARLESLKIES